MGFFSKLAFWKKKDEFESMGLGEKAIGLGQNPAAHDLGLGPTPGGIEGGYGLPTQPQQPSFQQAPPQPQFQQPISPQPAGVGAEKDLEVISSKLDALRVYLDSINQRLANLEAIARGEEEQSKKRYYRY